MELEIVAGRGSWTPRVSLRSTTRAESVAARRSARLAHRARVNAEARARRSTYRLSEWECPAFAVGGRSRRDDEWFLHWRRARQCRASSGSAAAPLHCADLGFRPQTPRATLRRQRMEARFHRHVR